MFRGDLVPFVQFKRREKHGGVLFLVKLQASACNFTKSNNPPWVFFTFLKLCKWYQIAQRTTFSDNCRENKSELIYSILQPKFGDNLQETQKS